MKILLCTDGSESSQKALEKTVMLAEKCEIDEIAIIHVYDSSQYTSLPFFPDGGISITEEEIEILEKIKEKERRESKKLLAKVSQIIKDKNIKVVDDDKYIIIKEPIMNLKYDKEIISKTKKGYEIKEGGLIDYSDNIKHNLTIELIK